MTGQVLERSRSRTRRVAPLLIGAGVAASATVALHLRDPHVSGSWGFCPWLLLTGTYCPGCGGLRAVNDLTELRLSDAASSNLLFVAALPFIVLLWSREVVWAWRGERRPWLSPRAFALVVSTLILGFWVVRNLPGAAWLTP
ncbi:DUF2752 domain-containing protein [Alteromonas gracilis]